MRSTTAGFAVLLCSLNLPVTAANFTIDNPADRIKNPAGTVNNPSAQIHNPAASISNPASRMNDPNPLSPSASPVPQPTETRAAPSQEPAVRLSAQPQKVPLRAVFVKRYHFKTAGAYICAAKKAFSRDDYREFLAVTEDALKRIHAGTLSASAATQQTLAKYQRFGYGLLEKNDK
jgi:hypothetical protein